ncbi:MAG: hypothetical protein HOP12_15955 [Candidatus Eisenbacteria bacterium]|uniref:Nal1 C-terminal domain-containing protein n=1 Tax=Eiseniibacteriota bacterium TaxID=2212470 RepID=A0A849T2Y5_UNCEI|nr:hypothetical protein [Candidatus Eisenbacteria bacterium]
MDRRARFGLVPSALLIAALAFGVASCAREATAPTAPTASAFTIAAPELARAVVAQDLASVDLLAIEGVAGTGAAVDELGQPIVEVYLESAGVSGIPASIGGVRVVTEVTGRYHAFALTGRYRPTPIGVSCGNANECLPGTLGCVLKVGRKRYALSANHVFARQNQATIGESIVQPSRPDSDPECAEPPTANVIGSLADFEPVVYDGKTPNVMDAAIARLAGDDFTCSTLPEFYGAPRANVKEPEIGLKVMKVGRTTGETHAKIKAINVQVKIFFPAGKALLVGQLKTSKAFGDFGDSGSLVVTENHARPVGMIIGGGNNGSAIVTPIGVILKRFGATICGD